jgi:replicative DNA helicase
MPESDTRLLPNNLEAERVILGAVLVHPPALFDAAGVLKTTDFYREAHRTIFEAYLALQKAQSPIDLITLFNQLKTSGQMERCGGPAYIAGLTEGVATAAAVKHYAKLVREAAVLRQLIQIGHDVMERGYAAEEQPKDIIGYLQGEIIKLGQQQDGKGFRPAREYVDTAYKQIVDIFERKDKTYGLSSGYKSLDYFTHGFKPGELIILAGRPGHGKTSLAQNIADHIVIHQKKRVGVFSMEMSGQELVTRSIYAEANVDPYELGRQPTDWGRIQSACAVLSEGGLFIDESAGLNISEISSKAQALILEHKIDLLIVDYLQLMAGTSKRSDNRVAEISEISRGLKVLAKNLQIPVMALSQLNREIEKTTRKPHLSDLRESGSIEQDADVVLFIWREELRCRRPDNEGEAVLIVAKNRNGKTAEIEPGWMFNKRICRFVE